MKTIIALALLSMTFCHLLDSFAITRENVAELKNIASYEVYDYEEHPFKDLSMYELKQKLGLRGMPFHELTSLPQGQANDDIPENFDSRVTFKKCIHEIRDQKSCGSCWAFAVSEFISDRFCIATDGKVDVVLSPQQSVSCDKNNLGCNGGYLDRALKYIQANGLVSDDCYPYTSGAGVTGTCLLKEGTCVNKNVEFKKYFTQAHYTFRTVNDIKADIVANGPLETGFLVYQDFTSYKSGIYQKTSNTLLGGHAVKIVGFGVENGTQYWIVANSWGPNWGEQGHFRIAINNCCNFEAQAIAAKPKVDATEFLA